MIYKKQVIKSQFDTFYSKLDFLFKKKHRKKQLIVLTRIQLDFGGKCQSNCLISVCLNTNLSKVLDLCSYDWFELYKQPNTMKMLCFDPFLH